MSETAIAIREEEAPLTAQQIKANRRLVQEVMETVMQDGTHYGVIPGCGDKPALLKPGAEKLASVFRIAVDPIIEDLSGPDCVCIRIRCLGRSPSGAVLGAGLGQCSSDEDKYRWRAAVHPKEWDATPEDRRREKWRANQPQPIRQVRTNIADVANTVLKIAKKRAQVDMVLTVTAASDIFTQDIDDDDTAREQAEAAAKRQPPRRASQVAAAAPPPAQQQAAQQAPPQSPPPAPAAITIEAVTQLAIGAGFATAGQVRSIFPRKGKDEKPFCDLTIGDDTGELRFRLWAPVPPFAIVGAAVKLEGSVKEYQGGAQYVISQIAAAQP